VLLSPCDRDDWRDREMWNMRLDLALERPIIAQSNDQDNLASMARQISVLARSSVLPTVLLRVISSRAPW